MHRFFCPDWDGRAGEVPLPPAEARHATKVLRLEDGERVGVLNGRGDSAIAPLSLAERGRDVRCLVAEVTHTPRAELPVRLYVAPPKGKNMDALLRAATELGVSRLTPVLCRYSVSRPDGAKEGWREQLVAACKQSGNPWLPELDAAMPFAAALEHSREAHFVGAVPGTGNSRSPDAQRLQEAGAALWIGPEGGFAPEEELALHQAGAVGLTVGRWILRVETAVPALLGRLDGFLCDFLAKNA